MKRDEILTAAAGVFAQHGFRGSTTRRIADAAGVNEITIFRQFGSKEALIREAMQHITQSAGLEALPDIPADPERELTQWSDSFMQHLRLRNSIIRKTMSEIEERPDIFDPKSAAAMLMGAIFSDAMGRDMMPDVFPQPQERAARLYTRLLLRALGVTNGARKTTSKQSKRPKQLSA